MCQRFKQPQNVTVLSECEDLGKMDVQLIGNEQNQDRAQCEKNEARGMISWVCRAE